MEFVTGLTFEPIDVPGSEGKCLFHVYSLIIFQVFENNHLIENRLNND